MSTKTLNGDKKLAKHVMISQRCLGIVLKRIDKSQASLEKDETLKNGDYGPLSMGYDTATEDWMFESGYLIFQEFQEENRHCYWNPTLIDSVNNVEYMGYVAPGTLLICGNEYYLEALRSAWARRVLKPPANFVINRLGDVTGLEIQVIPQTQFTPLPEALCLVVSELNSANETASLEIIFSHLQERFSDMIVPNQDIVYASLGKLIKDRKIYHTGDGYFIVTPETYHVTTMCPLPERPLLMSNEEAIHKLHGGELLGPYKPLQTRTRSIQTNIDEVTTLYGATKSPSEYTLSPKKLERSGSLRLSRKEKHKSQENGSFVRSESMRLSPTNSKSFIRDINLKSSPVHQNVEKGEKVSVFSKLFRRSSSKRRKSSKSPAKYSTFSAQFPPLEWSDPGIIHYHSRSTQTLEGRSSSKDSRPQTSAMALNSSNVSSAPLSAASHTSVKSKADSMARLRDQEKSTHRSRSSTLESVRLEKSYEPSSDVATPRSSGLPRKNLSHSCFIQDNPSGTSKRSSLSPKKTSSALTSRTSLSLYATSPSKNAKSQIKSGELPSNVTNGSLGRDPTKVSNTDQQQQYIALSENLHVSATVLNKIDESKAKNTEVRKDEEYGLKDVLGSGNSFGNDLAKKSSAKYLNRWSIHESEGLVNHPQSRGSMNNMTSPKKTSSVVNSTKHSGIKCVNKLHSGSPPQSATPSTKPPSNITAAVRPTQAIRPLNQFSQDNDKSCKDGMIGKKVTNTSPEASLTSSPSFNKSFDLESGDFKSITAQKLLKGLSINSIDTLVEVNMVADTNGTNSSQQNGHFQNNFHTGPTNSYSVKRVSGSTPTSIKSASSLTGNLKSDAKSLVQGKQPLLNNGSDCLGSPPESPSKEPITKAIGEAHRVRNSNEKIEGPTTPTASTDTKKVKSEALDATKVTALV